MMHCTGFSTALPKKLLLCIRIQNMNSVFEFYTNRKTEGREGNARSQPPRAFDHASRLALLIGTIVIAAVPWISIGLLH